MHSLTETIREAIHGVPGARSCSMARMKKPAGIGGILLLTLGVLGFIWIFPELRRYIRISRM
jgi:hypothetical protein